MGILDRLFGSKQAPVLAPTPPVVVVACTSCGGETNTHEVMISSILALADDEELNSAFEHLAWVDLSGAEVWPAVLGGAIADGVPISTLSSIARANQELRDSPELRALGVPVGDASSIPFWSTPHIAALLRRLENMGYASYVAEANGWNWPISCPVCQERRLSGNVPGRQRSARLRDPVPPRIRFAVMQRDGFRCTYCGRTAAEGAQLHVDHVIPVAAGGLDDDGNLVTACDECNLGKGATELP